MSALKDHMTTAQLAALPSPHYLMTEVVEFVDKWIEANALANISLPAINEIGFPVQVQTLRAIDRVANLWEDRIRANMSYIHFFCGDCEYYKFKESLKISIGTFKLRK